VFLELIACDTAHADGKKLPAGTRRDHKVNRGGSEESEYTSNSRLLLIFIHIQ
jgi:hypothetical protein